jgi:cytochrome bd-type quinol oxidase subunit 2
MGTVLLARIQFALTVGFHYIFPVITLGMAWIIVWMLTRHLRTGDPAYQRMARFWIRVFVLSFAVGVAASQNALTIMLVVALVGMPVVIGYSIFIYRTFSGPVRVEDVTEAY